MDGICGGCGSKDILDYTDDVAFERRAEGPAEEIWLLTHVVSAIKGVVEDSLDIKQFE